MWPLTWLLFVHGRMTCHPKWMAIIHKDEGIPNDNQCLKNYTYFRYSKTSVAFCNFQLHVRRIKRATGQIFRFIQPNLHKRVGEQKADVWPCPSWPFWGSICQENCICVCVRQPKHLKATSYRDSQTGRAIEGSAAKVLKVKTSERTSRTQSHFTWRSAWNTIWALHKLRKRITFPQHISSAEQTRILLDAISRENAP